MGCWFGLAVALGANALALWAAGRIFAGVEIHGFWAYLIGSAALGLANAILKPVLTILTLPLVILTLGLFYLLINIGMVALAAWVTPGFSVHGFWSYVGTVFLVWLINWAVNSLIEAGIQASREQPSG